MGRATYEVGLKVGVTGPDPAADLLDGQTYANGLQLLRYRLKH